MCQFVLLVSHFSTGRATAMVQSPLWPFSGFPAQVDEAPECPGRPFRRSGLRADTVHLAAEDVLTDLLCTDQESFQEC